MSFPAVAWMAMCFSLLLPVLASGCSGDLSAPLALARLADACLLSLTAAGLSPRRRRLLAATPLMCPVAIRIPPRQPRPLIHSQLLRPRPPLNPPLRRQLQKTPLVDRRSSQGSSPPLPPLLLRRRLHLRRSPPPPRRPLCLPRLRRRPAPLRPARRPPARRRPRRRRRW